MGNSFETGGFGHSTVEVSPKVDRDVVLDAMVTLRATNPEIDFTDGKNPEIKKIQNLFNRWTEEIREIPEDPQKKLMEYLQQNMLFFDAGLITNEEGLKSLDEELDQLLLDTKANDDNFIEYEALIDGYKKRIGDMLKRSDK